MNACAEQRVRQRPCLGREHSGADKPGLGSPCYHRDTSSGVPAAVLASRVGLCLCWPTSDGPTLLYSQTHIFVQALALGKLQTAECAHPAQNQTCVWAQAQTHTRVCFAYPATCVHICAHLCCE